MKGIMMAAGLMTMAMGISLGLMFYISYEQLRLETQTALKQALGETMAALDALDPSQRSDQALSEFVADFTLRKQSGVAYSVDLMGFNSDPLALRIRVSAIDTHALFDLRLTAEETMIEVGNENQ